MEAGNIFSAQYDTDSFSIQNRGRTQSIAVFNVQSLRVITRLQSWLRTVSMNSLRGPTHLPAFESGASSMQYHYVEGSPSSSGCLRREQNQRFSRQILNLTSPMAMSTYVVLKGNSPISSCARRSCSLRLLFSVRTSISWRSSTISSTTSSERINLTAATKPAHRSDADLHILVIGVISSVITYGSTRRMSGLWSGEWLSLRNYSESNPASKLVRNLV